MQIGYSLGFVKALIRTAAAPRGGSLNTKFTFKGMSPPTTFARIDGPTFTPSNSVADFLPEKCNFSRKMAVLRFKPSVGA